MFNKKKKCILIMDIEFTNEETTRIALSCKSILDAHRFIKQVNSRMNNQAFLVIGKVHEAFTYRVKDIKCIEWTINEQV